MAFTNSKIFRAFLADVLDNTTAVDLGTDVPKVSLFGNGGTPDQDATSANTAYNVAQWANANGVQDASNWTYAGRPLASTSLSSATSATVYYDAADTSGAGVCTMSSIYGCLVYDDTLTTPVADQGICYNYFGGAQSVTGGTFTIVWHANGIFRFTL